MKCITFLTTLLLALPAACRSGFVVRETKGIHAGHLGFQPEGLVHPLPGSKAPVQVENEVQRPERPTH